METSDIAHETSSTKLLQKYFILPLPNAGIPTTRGAHLDSVHRPDIQNTPRQNVETVSRKGITILPFLLSLPPMRRTRRAINTIMQNRRGGSKRKGSPRI